MAAPKKKPTPKKSANQDNQYRVRKFKDACRSMRGKGANPTLEITKTLPTGEHIRLERTQKCPRGGECSERGFIGIYIGTGFGSEDEPKDTKIAYCPNCGRIARLASTTQPAGNKTQPP